ncbi:hypothetical protein ECANGB1_1157 [Enterospora canceri]|uniref:Uncharacterized protein n=1 Tax=Enterospora canceri TaxID=1081671 RepID=A0A1Y1S6K8_9MICR|nr:hypothetical protein ECANGB1_1157 [Enterospora canceri]
MFGCILTAQAVLYCGNCGKHETDLFSNTCCNCKSTASFCCDCVDNLDKDCTECELVELTSQISINHERDDERKEKIREPIGRLAQSICSTGNDKTEKVMYTQKGSKRVRPNPSTTNQLTIQRPQAIQTSGS